ncbi:transcriptional regulator [Marine Group I thaumarchaeote]|uniref:Transcriptional regulator n=2 Tax=Nitrososphaerota TaxID=651137 RepID=A0A7K4NEV0_9ARCH|nr:Mn-dependent transcriptional regulator MntR [uncultured marine crenarchaeote SAT1000-49-D2]NWJ21610.1 transcriptional regulator [Marine Group I thaumarchaeote]PBO83519.1 MAG: transcriptional regulator [Nitrosopumilales archaeon]RTZ70088.1 MAG: transcriptional regulator [Nitrososphaerota archaeon]NWJ43365.1 transcriptional regulator [Marine Group I thaumarchaeote]
MKKISKRLESIKAAHITKKVSSTTREEDYLEVIAELVELKGYATALDISRFMNVSPPSVTKMLQKLDEKKYLEYEKYHGINLTDMGKQVADTIRRKHSTLLEFFEILNIGKEIANQDTEGLEHHLNPKTIRQLRKYITFLKSNPKIIKQFHEF